LIPPDRRRKIGAVGFLHGICLDRVLGRQFTGAALWVTILTYGQINYAPAIAASVLTSLFGYWLSGENTESEE
jgi:hypothetical protein